MDSITEYEPPVRRFVAAVHGDTTCVQSREYKTLLSVLRDARLKAGLTQVELAARLRVQQAWVSKSEGRTRRLDVIELRQICHALEIDFVEFVRHLDAELGSRS